MSMRPVILFNVNGTLFDMSAVGSELRRIFGPIVTAREFYLETIQYSLALTMLGQYLDYGRIAEGVLRANAQAHGVTLHDADVDSVREILTSLPVFGDVQTTLQRLKTAGLRLATLTNGTSKSQAKLLHHAGLETFFEQTLSVETVHKFKPALDTYQAAAESLRVTPREIFMVAAHSWDLIGARQAGCKTVFVSRPGEGWFEGADKPDIVTDSLTAAADQILTRTEQL